MAGRGTTGRSDRQQGCGGQVSEDPGWFSAGLTERARS